MQYRRIISAVLVPATLVFFTGCTKTVWISPEQLQPEETVKVVAAEILSVRAVAGGAT